MSIYLTLLQCSLHLRILVLFVCANVFRHPVVPLVLCNFLSFLQLLESDLHPIVHLSALGRLKGERENERKIRSLLCAPEKKAQNWAIVPHHTLELRHMEKWRSAEEG